MVRQRNSAENSYGQKIKLQAAHDLCHPWRIDATETHQTAPIVVLASPRHVGGGVEVSDRRYDAFRRGVEQETPRAFVVSRLPMMIAA
jgi:hypothetical protein